MVVVKVLEPGAFEFTHAYKEIRGKAITFDNVVKHKDSYFILDSDMTPDQVYY